MKKKLFLYSVLIPLGIVFLDQWTKLSVTEFFNVPFNICEMNLVPVKYHSLPGPMDISLVCNPGISWGLLQGDSEFKFGAVTDFIDFSEIGFHWVFNVADTSISCGVIGLILASFINEKKCTISEEK